MLLTFYLTRTTTVSKNEEVSAVLPFQDPEVKSIDDAVLLVGAGGRIIYTNNLAKDWFGYPSGLPNLERLANRAQPSEVFLGLCSQEGTARFSIDGRLIDGVSYLVPSTLTNASNSHQKDQAMLVSLRKPKVDLISPVEHSVSYETISLFSKLSEQIITHLELELTIKAFLESVDKLVTADWLEITILDPINQHLTPYRLSGAPGVHRRLEKPKEVYLQGKGLSGFLISHPTPLLIGNMDEFREVKPVVSRNQFPFLSYLGIPLSYNQELIGTLEIASQLENQFTENDLEILRLIAVPGTVALKNAIRFEAEKRRVHELSGLTNLSKTINNLTDVHDLLTRLIAEISDLVHSKVLGFLLYRESHHLLEAQPPFRGIPEQLISLYRVEIIPGSPAEEIINRQERIVALDAVNDDTLKALGLDGMAVASGIQNTILIPLKTSSRNLGYLQVADRLDGFPFDEEDLRLLEIISMQSAAILENATLVRESQSRAQRSETLRRVASLAGSSATLDEIMTHSLRELVRLLRADAGLLYLLDEYLGDLALHSASLLTSGESPSVTIDRINMTDTRFAETVTCTMNAVFISDISDGLNLSDFYHSLYERFNFKSALIVPFIVRGQGVGEVILTSQESNHFDQNDLTLVTTTTSQLSVAIEKAALYGQTDESLQRRVVQLLALNRISRELSTTLELRRLLQVVYEQVVQTTEADCGAIFLFEQAENALRNPRVSFHVGDSVSGSLTPIEHKVLRAGEPYIVKDYLSPDPNAPDTMPIPPHPNVRSSLIVPIAYQNYVAGLIHLHAHTPERFDTTSQEIAQSLAVQAAIAIGNAQRYQEQQSRNELLNRRVETLTALLETTKSLQAGQPLDESLEMIAYGIQSATPFDMVLISVYNPNSDHLERVAGAGIPIDTFTDIKSRTPSWASVQRLLKPEFKNGRSYFIPEEQKSAIPPEIRVEHVDSEEVDIKPVNDQTWRSEDLLLIPLESSERGPLGLISVDSPRNNLRPDRPALDSLEIFANQAALIIETYIEITQLAERSENLHLELMKNRSSLLKVQQQLDELSEKEKAQTVSLSDSSLRLRRLHGSLEIADIVDQQKDRQGVLYTLASQIMENMAMDYVLVGELSETGPRMLYTLGEVPSGVTPQALLGQRNPLRTSLQSGKPIYAPDINDFEEWKNSPMLNALECRSFICQPVLRFINEGSLDSNPVVDAAILAISRGPLSNFNAADEEMFNLVTRQATIALQNLRVISEANRRLQEMNLLLEFSRQLGTFETSKILQTLVEGVLKVIPAAQAGMAALWIPELGHLDPVVALGYPDNEKILQIPYRVGESLPGKVFSDGQPLRQAEVLFAQDYNLQQEQLLLYRDATQGRLPVSAMIVPLQSFESKLGILVLDNFIEPDAFTPEDQTLVMALASQTSLTLQNVQLYQATQARTAQLQTLTKVAGTITSSLQREDIIRSLLDQIHTIVRFDTGTLWLRQSGRMTIHVASGFEDNEQREGLSVELEDSSLLHEMATTNRPLYVGDVRQDDRFPSLLEHRYLSWLGVPLLTKGDMVGVIVLEKEEANFFTEEHSQALVTFAGQAAVALENAKLYEESVQRAKELDERSTRLSQLNRLSAELSGSLDLDRILKVLAQEMHQAISSSMVSVALAYESGQIEVLIQEPLQDQQIGLPFFLPESAVLSRIKEGLGVFSSDDISQESDMGDLIGYFDSTGTRSLLIVPLISGNNLIGMTFIHSTDSVRFSPEEVALAKTINNQSAVAIQNANLFQQTEKLIHETQQRSSELAALFELGVQFTQVLDQDRLLDITFENVDHLIHPESIDVTLAESEDRLVLHQFSHNHRLDPAIIKPDGSSFSNYVIQTSKPILISDTLKADLPIPALTPKGSARSWLGVPLVVRGVTNGAICIYSQQADIFGEAQLQLLSQIANQLSVALDNAQLFRTVQIYTEELEQRVSERTEQFTREHRRIQTLLSITTELSASLDLDLVLSRTLSVVNETIEAEHATILLIQPENPYLFLRASQGYTGSFPQSGQISKLQRDEGMAGWVIQNRQSVLIGDLHSDNRWELRPDRTSLHRSAMIVPLLVGEEILGVLMVFHRSPNAFSTDQLDLIQAVAKQIAIAINNTQLYGLIRDQAERLGDMLRTQHIETSRSQAILEAVADGVLVTDARRSITLFNASAEALLGLSRADVLGKSLEQFIGLFGRAAQTWVQTIRTWSEDPEMYEIGETYAEQIELENRRVVSVHLSPVHLRSDFLGTVSVFRDITHQVEVDRLKSEFVATVSHELRTPMTSIKGYVEVLLMGAAGQLTQQQTHYLDVVKGNTERLAVLVNDLLDVSRIEAGKVTLSMQPIDLQVITVELFDQFEQRMEKENRFIAMEKHIPDNLPMVEGDPERIRQILDNLIENAYQYTPVGGKISVRMNLENQNVQVDILDNGIGIKPEEHDRVFERFYRGEDPMVLATSGTGLGLSIVKTLVEMHHGEIWFESEGIPGMGSAFSFTLPVYKPGSEFAFGEAASLELVEGQQVSSEGPDGDEGDWILS